MLEHVLFSFAGMEVPIVLGIIAIFLLFGSKKIPDLARSLGKAKGEFKRGQNEFNDELKKEPSDREKLESAAKALKISVEGKSDEELREAVKKALEKKWAFIPYF